MKTQIQKRRFSLLMAHLTICAVTIYPAPAQDLIINGGFELPVLNVTNIYETRTEFQLPGWTMPASIRGVHQFGTNYYLPNPFIPEGNQAVQIESEGDILSQSIRTVTGGQYQLAFHLSTSDFGNLNVQVSSAASNYVATGSEWIRHSLQFTAVSSTTTVSFRNSGPNRVSYPHVDHVTITPISIPEEVMIRWSAVEVSWLAKSNYNYRVQYRSAITASDWTDLSTTNILGTGTLLSVSDMIPVNSPQRFYRIVAFSP